MRRIEIAVGWKEDFDHRDPVERLRLAVLDVVYGRRQRALGWDTIRLDIS